VNLNNKKYYGGILIFVCISVFIIGFVIGTKIPLEALRLEMIEKNIVFCSVEKANAFTQPIAVPNNITWEDLKTWDNWKQTG
jgi:hypothetical protein